MFLDQTFALTDIPKIFTLTFLEMLLSADNAVVLGMLSRSLPQHSRRKALFIGIFSSFILRAAALFAVAFLFRSLWIQAFGGAYLLYLSIRFFVRRGRSIEVKPVHSFWKVVILIELLDIVFAIDSIVAGLAFINGAFSKLWIVYFGAMLGIIGIRYAAGIFGSLIDRFSRLEMGAYLMVGWIGIKLIFSSVHYPLPSLLFWSVIAALFLLGFYRSRR